MQLYVMTSKKSLMTTPTYALEVRTKQHFGNFFSTEIHHLRGFQNLQQRINWNGCVCFMENN
jgi:hypothetical protein